MFVYVIMGKISEVRTSAQMKLWLTCNAARFDTIVYINESCYPFLCPGLFSQFAIKLY